MNRILIFVHYHPMHGLSRHVLFSLSQLRSYYKYVIFVSNSALSDEQIHLIDQYADQTLCRENKGFDFGGWRDAIRAFGKQTMRQYDSLTLMNDTCFGPLSDMQLVFDTMDKTDADFWGLTRHKKATRGMPETDGVIPEHLQSYFMCFNRNVLLSEVLYNFFEKVDDHQSVFRVIKECETKLTKVLKDAGYAYQAYMDIRYNGMPYNDKAIYFEPEEQLKKGNPFIKIKSFLFFQDPVYLKALFAAHTGFDVSMVDEHMNAVFPPDISVQFQNKTAIICPSLADPGGMNKKVAMHFHVYYLDVFLKYLHPLSETIQLPIDLYITTDTMEKKKALETMMRGMQGALHLKHVVITENRGRDVAPWLTIASLLEGYDYVGHFHTKKSTSNTAWIGDAWMREMMDTLVYKADAIVKIFEDNPRVGIVIPDIPRFFKNMYGINIWGKTRAEFHKLWRKMELSGNVDPDKILSPVMPYGTMFWYRPLALKPLMDLGLTSLDFPEEPMDNDGTLAHAIESLPVYIAWSMGFDFRIVLHPEYVYSGFNYGYFLRMMHDCQRMQQSASWRTGRIILWAPGIIYRYVQSLCKRVFINRKIP